MALRARRTVLGVLVWLVAILVAIYLGLLVLLAVTQRRMMYFPGGEHGSAASLGLPHAQTLRLETVDHQSVVAWFQPAEPGHLFFIYFHGNGGTLAIHADWLGELAEDGSGFLAIDYRGYGGSTGSPTEAGLIRDGEAAYVKARALGYPPERIVLIGESLGTGVAVALAAAHPIHALILDSAYSSTADIAADQYWMFPVRLFMLDTFDSFDRIRRVEAPKLFLHATDDPVISLTYGRKLFAEAKPPKTFIEVPSIDHMVLRQPQVLAEVKQWLADLPAPHS